MEDTLKEKLEDEFKESIVDQTQGSAGMVIYNYNPVDGTITPTNTPVQVEIGNLDLARQIGQQVHIQYGCLQSIPGGQGQQILVAQPSSAPVPTQAEAQESPSQQLVISKPKPKGKNPNGERVPCPHCGKTYSCNANLRDHLRLHTGERPFVCSECGLTFAQRSNWRLHKRVHTGERPYMCGICGKTFSRSSHLPGHVRVHTGERPFQCRSCHQSFASSQALKNHARTHTGEKPFVCDVCSTSFTHSSSLSSHRKRCTGQMRKRGRPLGQNRKRGRPRKKKAMRPSRRKAIEQESVEDSTSSIKVEEDDMKELGSTNGEDDCPPSSPLKFASTELSPMESDAVEISVELAGRVEDDDSMSSDLVRPNENEGISILPDDGGSIESKIIVESGDVQSAVSAAAFTDHVDLRQEAAVTMATLHHGATNPVHTIQDDSNEHAPNQSTFYKEDQ